MEGRSTETNVIVVKRILYKGIKIIKKENTFLSVNSIFSYSNISYLK